MRSCLLWTALLLALSGFAQDQKIGHVDSQQIMMALPARKAAEDKVRKKAEELDARIKAMVVEYDRTAADLNARFSEMTRTEQAMAQRELAQIQERIRSAQETAEDDLEALQNELLAPILKQVRDAINEVASSNGFTYVFDSAAGTLLYHANGEDITPLVKAKLGI